MRDAMSSVGSAAQNVENNHARLTTSTPNFPGLDHHYQNTQKVEQRDTEINTYKRNTNVFVLALITAPCRLLHIITSEKQQRSGAYTEVLADSIVTLYSPDVIH